MTASRNDGARGGGKSAGGEKPTVFKRNYTPTSVRMRAIELEAIQKAAAALSTPTVNIDVAQFIWSAAYTEATELGFTVGTLEEGRTMRHQAHWAYEPDRPEDESLVARKNVTIPPMLEAVIQQAAASVKVPFGLFLVGSALKIIRDKQKRLKSNKALQAIELPEKFRKL